MLWILYTIYTIHYLIAQEIALTHKCLINLIKNREEILGIWSSKDRGIPAKTIQNFNEA